jgi:hypothetical protein
MEKDHEMPNKVSQQTLREIVGVVGAGLTGYGAWLHYQPLGFIVGGGVLVLIAIIGTIKGNA